ncbi:MAG: hypothetical protein CME62_17390 [Halobacteriovoraceae bacterium]|nr:hypothetical protein [Halobacteriovoraceae bacterium]
MTTDTSVLKHSVTRTITSLLLRMIQLTSTKIMMTMVTMMTAEVFAMITIETLVFVTIKICKIKISGALVASL